MRLWLRVALLSFAISMTGIAVTGVTTVRSGHRSILDSAVAMLYRDARLVASLLKSQYAGSTIDEPAHGPTTDSVASFLGAWAGTLVEPGMEAEVRTEEGLTLYTWGTVYGELDAGDRPEERMARTGRTSWILRRVRGSLVLCLSMPETVSGAPLVVSVATDMRAMDSYVGRQSTTLLLVALGSLVLISASSYLGGRMISRRITALARQASALAAGTWQTRVRITGRDEVAALSRSFNSMASSIATTLERLRAETEARQAFIDDLTHELRTPVTSIVGFAEHLERCVYDEAVFSRALARIRSEGLRILRLSGDLTNLLLARTEAPAPQAVALLGLLERIAREAMERWPNHGVRVSVTPESACLAVGEGLVESVVRNLLDNAAAASPADAEIDIGWQEEGRGGSLFVRDRGSGLIPAEGRTHEHRGLGLGLTICRQIAAHWGARLELAPHPEGGTQASVIFPNSSGVGGPETTP